ncbi:PAS domain S-box protein [Mucilaginibacter pallidiroseus]|uniref:histidine kinase n=1 Tax=Mucilaginibacter pallidiroseus TaxID=2599295 RepID=A0A563UJL8_9SPHI|nr:PAS domain-containing protein [Mucilaginibacter pallidiroseus]TWR31557.1 PAS domain S-box protein [Mucilaginibacter pallidiroseus]
MNDNQFGELITGTGSTESLELLKAALDSSVSGIIITDNRLPDNPIVYCNASFERISGYSRPEIIGHNCRFLQARDRKQPERQMLKEAIVEGKTVNVEIRNYTKDGTLFWNELYVSPIKNAEGQVTHFVGVQHDVTRRKNAEHTLRNERELIEQTVKQRTLSLEQTREYLESIIQTVRESLLVLDAEFRVMTANQHFLKTFKVDRSETIGQNLFNLGNGQWDIDRLKELLNDILPTNNPVLDFEVEHDFPHIGRKLMLLNAYRIELEGEFKDRILLSIEDITERRAIEVRKDDFLSVASHELKTPLTTVKGYVQVINHMLSEQSGDKLKEIVGKTSTQIDRLNKLIAELLDVSKIQSGNLEIHRDVFDFDKMVKEVIENIQSVSPNHTIKLSGATNVTYSGDESQLTQVISNLLSNAIKYSPDHQEISVYLSVISGYLKFSVSDQGLGINQNDQAKIFERFYRVSNIQKKYPGMGIGLYVCEQIIKQHKGDLWVDSEENKGSTFSFTLPLLNDESK